MSGLIASSIISTIILKVIQVIFYTDTIKRESEIKNTLLFRLFKKHYNFLLSYQVKLQETMKNAGITEYKSICLSTDQQEYEVTLKNGTEVTIPSGLPYHYDWVA